MTIEEFLAEDGLTPEQIKAIVGDPIQAKAMTKALAKYEQGNTLSTSAKADRDAAEAAKVEAENFWEQKVTPALAGVDKKVATAQSDTARYKAYLQSLKDQGYDVPADLLTAPSNPNPNSTGRDNATGQFTREDFNKEMQGTSETLVTLMSLSNEYQDLYGAPYVAGETDFAEAKAARKPYREYVKSKYKFDEKKTAKAAAADQARIDKIVGEKVEAEKQKLVAQYGSNGETRAPLASKFDKIEKLAERKDSWKTNAGRQESRKNRLGKFENVVM